MKSIIIDIPQGFIIDIEKSSFTEIFFKKEEKKDVTCWEDLKKIKGYYISSGSEIYTVNCTTTLDNQNVFVTKEQAEASIALAMLSQLIKDVNEDWIPDWKSTDCFYNYSHFLTFPTEEIRDTFLKNHKELIIKAKPLL